MSRAPPFIKVFKQQSNAGIPQNSSANTNKSNNPNKASSGRPGSQPTNKQSTPKQVQTKLPTPKVHVLKELIRGCEKFDYLVQGFSEWFKLGLEDNFQSHSSRNHLSVLNDPQEAIKNYNKNLMQVEYQVPLIQHHFLTL